MDMQMSQEQNQAQEMTIKASPSLIEANYILSLSLPELRQTILNELSQNPALELVDHETCPFCGEVMLGGKCENCSREDSKIDHTDTVNEDLDSLYYESYSATSRSLVSDDEDDFDPMSIVASEQDFHESLRSDLHSILPEEDYEIADYLIESLDENGYLRQPLDAIARELGRDVQRVEWVLQRLQEIAPAGVGARNLQECLLLQLRYLEQEGEIIPEYVRAILENYIEELGSHKYGYIARKLKTSPEKVAEARQFIKQKLSPYPSLDPAVGRTWKSPAKSTYISPDVIIFEREGKLEVEVVEGRQFELRLSSAYQQIAKDLEARPHYYSDNERAHIKEYISRTKMFISNVNQRRKTIYKIASALVELQEDFIRYGVRHLKPLTRAMLADYIGVHESTVSRATAGKYVMLPNRKVIPFSDFFTASLSIKDVIKEIITSEDKALTDRQICDKLRERGIRVARRTVAKYRAELGILPSTLR